MSELGYRPFDCDNHYYEAEDAFTRHVPKNMRARCVQWAEIEGRNDLQAYLDERTARVPLGRRTDPAEMAELVVWLLLDAPEYVTAERLNGSGGLDRD